RAQGGELRRKRVKPPLRALRRRRRAPDGVRRLSKPPAPPSQPAHLRRRPAQLERQARDGARRRKGAKPWWRPMRTQAEAGGAAGSTRLPRATLLTTR